MAADAAYSPHPLIPNLLNLKCGAVAVAVADHAAANLVIQAAPAHMWLKLYAAPTSVAAHTLFVPVELHQHHRTVSAVLVMTAGQPVFN